MLGNCVVKKNFHTWSPTADRALWLVTRAGKMEPSCLLGTTRCIPQAKFPQRPYNKSFIDQVCSVKMAGYWPHSFFASLWTSTSSQSINTQKKNLANIQPSWAHTWSITHTHGAYLAHVKWRQHGWVVRAPDFWNLEVAGSSLSLSTKLELFLGGPQFNSLSMLVNS